jgi:ATP-binding protein involved in chromosome partitioning
VVVTTPQKVALADAIKAIAMFRQPQIQVPLLGLIENMAYFTPAELPANKYYIFGKDGGKVLAERFDIPFLGEVPLVQALREGGDVGTPIAIEEEHPVGKAFAAIAASLAQQLAVRNAQAETTV